MRRSHRKVDLYNGDVLKFRFGSLKQHCIYTLSDLEFDMASFPWKRLYGLLVYTKGVPLILTKHEGSNSNLSLLASTDCLPSPFSLPLTCSASPSSSPAPCRHMTWTPGTLASVLQRLHVPRSCTWHIILQSPVFLDS